MISIGIPTVNGSHRLERCLSHIFKDDSVKRFNAEVLVVDDGSDESHLARNKEFCDQYKARLIEHGSRRGVPTGWNTLTQHSINDIVILLNDDIEVMKHWLDVVVYTLQNNPSIGAVGLNSYEGRRETMPPVASYNESHPMFGGVQHPLLSCCGSAFAFRKSDYHSVGGFDERYFCFYEEIDFCLSLMTIGKRSCILTYPTLHHYVAETTTTVLANPQAVMEESQQKFESKWNVKWKEIRTKFNSSTIPPVPIVNEWNSTIAVWI
jgi:GT2 family glycosyltransferase